MRSRKKDEGNYDAVISRKENEFYMNYTNRKNLFNDGWEFALTAPDTTYEEAHAAKLDYKPVDIPHDWLIYDSDELYKSGCGFYRKYIDITDINTADYILYFDGVYMDSTLYVNGKNVCSWTYGYSSFQADISAYLEEGRNCIELRVNYVSPNSRWYSGAGIYRNVYLYKLSAVHLNIDGIYISADAESGDVYVNTETSGYGGNMPDLEIVHTVIGPDGNTAAQCRTDLKWSCVETTLHADNIKLWSLEERNLYTLRTELIVKMDGTVLDSSDDIFGFRSAVFDPDEGFILNGKHIKLKGVCLHHDLGCLGSAVNYSALERQLLLMKEMGANSVRTSHNMPAPELIEICDRIGLLVNCESFDMWELPKTDFDNARFFRETAHRDVMSWVKRDRNHPSVILWSIGNEIYDTHVNEHGYEIAEMLKNYVREFDYKCNAGVTIGSNFIEWENSQKIGEMLGISGYNYTERCYDAHHKKYPNTVIYGSETSSAVRSRGIYHFPADVPQLTHDDHQCSSLANSTVGWGKPAETAWIDDRDRKFCAGQYVWTGIDYIGEPTPYSTRNSYFGMADTCCLPKDIYYFYQSVWTDFKEKPMVHLLPYWDFNDGQPIDVIAYTNAPAVELFVNGRSQGIQHIDHEHGNVLHGQWLVPYKEGCICAKAYDENGHAVAETERHSFTDPVRVCAQAERPVIKADGRDISFVVISVCDSDGYPVENARNRVNVTVSGNGVLMGMDNGDSTDKDQYKTNSRRLFSGKAVCAVRSSTESGDIVVRVASEGLESTEIVIKTEKCDIPEGISCSDHVDCTENITGDIPVRAIKCSCGNTKLDKEDPESEIVLKILPENASYSDITCTAVKDGGAPAPNGRAEYEDGKIKVKGLGDGKFTVRVYCNNGSEFPQVISETNFECSGMGQAVRDPYSFICANTFALSRNSVNLIENNSLGGFSAGSMAVYTGVDFGRAGSDSVTIYIGNCNNRDIPVKLYDGAPDEARLIDTLMFPHNNGWDHAEPITYKLPETLRGVHTVTIGIDDGCIFGGFEFTKTEEAYAELLPVYNDEMYGDDYTISGERIIGIGNNVVIGFKDMDFAHGAGHIIIKGRTANKVNTIQLRTVKDGVQKTQLLEFAGCEDYREQRFVVERLEGVNDVSFVFLPGSSFDFESFRFEE